MRFYTIVLCALLFSCQNIETDENSDQLSKQEKDIKNSSTEKKTASPRLVIHGGAGNILKENFTPEKQKAYEDKLSEALRIGYKILNEGGTSTEAVVSTLQVLERSPLFNAGIGAVLTNDETVSHDASIMNGETNQAGAIAGSNQIESPIMAAYMVMNNSDHVLLSGEGAHKFARSQQLSMVTPDHFITEKRLDQLRKVKNRSKADIDPFILDKKMGTVGACALDKFGNLAAGTSTGGMTNKKYGRIGDSPIIGAGTYANNETCAVSSTGHGEFFIRNVVAYDIAARIKYNQQDLVSASNETIDQLGSKNGTGGVICLDKQGNINMPFNTAGMFRGYYTDSSGIVVKLFSDQ